MGSVQDVIDKISENLFRFCLDNPEMRKTFSLM